MGIAFFVPAMTVERLKGRKGKTRMAVWVTGSGNLTDALMSNQKEPPLQYKLKGPLKEKQFKVQIEQPRQSLGEEILWNDVMWEQRTKHFYLNPRQLNEPANSMDKMGFKGSPSSWGTASQSVRTH